MGDVIDNTSCLLFQLINYNGVLSLMCIVGFAGNIASIIVLQKDHTSATATFLLRALAAADAAFLVIWTLYYSVGNLLKHLGIDSAAPWLYIRVSVFPCLYVTQALTIWLVVVVACNRLIVVCMPCRAQYLCCLRNFKLTVGIVALGAVLSNIPRFFEIQVVRNETDGSLHWERSSFAKSAVYRIVYTDIVYYLMSFVLPLVIIAFANVRVIGAYRAAKRLQSSGGGTGGALNENAITLVMIVIVVVFVACQAPARLVQMVWGYRANQCDPVFYLIHVSNSLEVFNSSVNFFIYVVFYKRFRLLLGRCICVGPLAERDEGPTETTEGLYLEEHRWEPTPEQARGGHGEVVLEASSTDEHEARLNGDVVGIPVKAIVLCE